MLYSTVCVHIPVLQALSTDCVLSVLQNEDEWEDFNEPKEKDYSGLKVQSFQTV